MNGDFGNLSADYKRGGSNGETYLSKCHSPETNLTGTYRIAVNYFEGVPPTNARIRIRTKQNSEDFDF